MTSMMHRSVYLMLIALSAMGDHQTVYRTLAVLGFKAQHRNIYSVDALLRIIEEVGEWLLARKISRRLSELKKGESADAVAGLWALAQANEYDVGCAFGCAVNFAEACCGEHPNRFELFNQIDFDHEGFRFGPAWDFWGDLSPKAVAAAREGFVARLLNIAGLGDEPELKGGINDDHDSSQLRDDAR